MDFIDYAYRHYELCLEYFELLEHNYIPYSMLTFEKNIQMNMVHTNFLNAIGVKLTELNKLEQ